MVIVQYWENRIGVSDILFFFLNFSTLYFVVFVLCIVLLECHLLLLLILVIIMIMNR